jgi:hypothetical protein
MRKEVTNELTEVFQLLGELRPIGTGDANLFSGSRLFGVRLSLSYSEWPGSTCRCLLASSGNSARLMEIQRGIAHGGR